MAINIKPIRGEIEQKSIGTRGSPILDSVRSNRIDYKSFTNELTSIAQTINTHNDKLNQRRIVNKSTKYDAKMAIDVNNFSQDIEIGKYNAETQTYDPYTLDEITKKQEEFNTKMEKKYKNTIYKDDDVAWEHFSSYYWNNLKAADLGSHQGNKKKILADTAIAYQTFKTTQDINITNTGANDHMWDKLEFMIKQEKDMFVANDGVSKIDLAKNINDITQKFLVKAIKGGHEITLENGEKGYDWDSIRNEVNDENHDYYKRKLSIDERKGLIEYIKEQSVEQNFFEDAWVTNNNETIFKNKIDGIIKGDVKISEIKLLDLRRLEGEKLRNGLIEIATKVQLGEYGDESNIANFLEIRARILDGTITSLTEDIKLKSDEPKTEGKNILERVGTSIGNTDFERLNTVLQNKDNKRWGVEYQQLQKLVVSRKSEIEGVMKDFDMAASVRMYDFESELEIEFFKQLKEGKSSTELLNPQSKDFILRPELLKKYVLSVSEQAKLVATQMSEKKSVGLYEGPMWDDEMKKKYNNDVSAFMNGTERQNYFKTTSGIAYITNQPTIDVEIEKNVAVISALKAKDKKIEALRKLNIKQEDVKQMTIDLTELNSANFTSKYRVMKEQFKKAIGYTKPKK